MRFLKQIEKTLIYQEFIMTELADVRAAIEEAKTLVRAAINQHSVSLVKPVASQADLDLLIAEIKKFTFETVETVKALTPEPMNQMAQPSKTPFPFSPPGPAERPENGKPFMPPAQPVEEDHGAPPKTAS